MWLNMDIYVAKYMDIYGAKYVYDIYYLICYDIA